MREDRGESAETVDRVAIDVVCTIAEYGAAAGRHNCSTIPRDHRMRDPKSGIRVRAKAEIVISGNDIAIKMEVGAAPDAESASTPVPVFFLLALARRKDRKREAPCRLITMRS